MRISHNTREGKVAVYEFRIQSIMAVFMALGMKDRPESDGESRVFLRFIALRNISLLNCTMTILRKAQPSHFCLLFFLAKNYSYNFLMVTVMNKKIKNKLRAESVHGL